MKVTVLVENTKPEGSALHAEHGLSLHFTHGGKEYLLDAGHSDRFLKNAAALGVDLARVDQAFLSHGHFDHADGFPWFFAANDHAPVHTRAAARLPDYHGEEYIGVNPAIFRDFPDRFLYSEQPLEAAPGLWTVPDSLAHEQSVVVCTEGGLVVMNSCCHAGVCSILADLERLFPGVPVRAVLGGFHLMGPAGVSSLGVPPERVAEIGDTLTGALNVGTVYTGHCTGSPALSLLSSAHPGRVLPLRTGDCYEF